MNISIIIIIISFLLDGLLSIYRHYFIFDLLPLFTITSLIIIYPLLYNKINNYYKIIIILGLLYDIVYTNTLLLNVSLFLLLSYIIKNYYFYLKNNLFNGIILNIIIIMLYRFASFSISFNQLYFI